MCGRERVWAAKGCGREDRAPHASLRTVPSSPAGGRLRPAALPARASAAASCGGAPRSSGAFLLTQNSCGLACASEKGEAECKANLLAGSSFPCGVAAAPTSQGHCFCFSRFPRLLPDPHVG